MLGFLVTGDSDDRLSITAGGTISWGPGNAVEDITLSRGAANRLDLGSGDSLGITDADIVLGTSTGTKIGTATAQKLAFHNSTPVIQRVGAAQAAVVTTAATNVTPFGYATAAQADAIVALVNELRAAVVEKGLIKGAA